VSFILISHIYWSRMLGHARRVKTPGVPMCAWHALLFAFETCAAVFLGAYLNRCGPDEVELEDLHAANDVSPGMQAFAQMRPPAGRRLVANDFNANFARRLTFHRWLEEDVVLDRNGLAQYLKRARTAAGLEVPAAVDAQQRAQLPQAGVFLKGSMRKWSAARGGDARAASSLDLEAALASQAHHVDPRSGRGGAPWAHGRDEFMRYVRHGLRPGHHFLGLGCGPFAAGEHVVRYLLSGRYHCIEHDEYLLRAAVEYEIPANGLIYKRPRFILVRDLGDAAGVSSAISAAPSTSSGIPPPPSLFDFVAIQRWPLQKTASGRNHDLLHNLLNSAVRVLRPRTGRLLVPDEPLPMRVRLRLGLRQVEHELDALAEQNADHLAACPFSVQCKMYAYYTARASR
jgi:hypothetical protein